MTEYADLARQMAREAAKTAIVKYQNELLKLLVIALEQGYTKEQIVDALLLELQKDVQ